MTQEKRATGLDSLDVKLTWAFPVVQGGDPDFMDYTEFSLHSSFNARTATGVRFQTCAAAVTGMAESVMKKWEIENHLYLSVK